MPQALVVVQTCPARRESLGPTLESIEKSDIGSAYELMEHPPELSRCEFFETVIARMASADTEYVIRMEDDVLVNRHLLSNALTWPAFQHPLFGAGWLFASQMAIEDCGALMFSDGLLYRGIPDTYGSLCVVLPRWLATKCLTWWHAAPSECSLVACNCGRPQRQEKRGQDTIFSRVAWDLGKRVFYHWPVLAENRDLPSAFGTGYASDPMLERHLKAGPCFEPDWKRE